MKCAPILDNEDARLETLRSFQILDTLEEAVFDDVTKLASAICKTPIALVSLVDKDRQWFKSRIGIDATETARDVSFCGHAIHENKVFEIPDAQKDERFHDNPFVKEGIKLRFYAGAPIVAGNGHAIGTLCVIDDKPHELTSEQREALSALSRHVTHLLELRVLGKEKNYLTSLLNGMDEGMITMSADRRILDCNPAALEIFGLTRAELFSAKFHDLVKIAMRDNGSQIPDDERPAALAMRTGKQQRNVSVGIKRTDGATRWLTVNASPVFEEGNSKPSYVISTFRDVTEFKQRSAMLMQSSRLATVGEMAGGMAHEINNPLSIISASTDLVSRELGKKEPDMTRVSTKLSNIKDMVNRISEIIGGLRAFARSSDKDPMFKVSLAKIIDETARLCTQRFVSHGVELRAKPLEVDIECREAQISQVIMSLLSNAYDAVQSLDAKWVEIEAKQIGGNVEISVTDSGRGLDPSVSDKVMQPFFTTKPIGKGAGLGLSIASGVAEEHHGRLYYDSESKNTRFVLQIPLKTQKFGQVF